MTEVGLMEGGEIKIKILVLYKELFNNEICPTMGEADLKNSASESMK